MIVYDKEQKQIVIPNGLGNVNIVINQGGGECPECPECPGECILEDRSVFPSIEEIRDGYLYVEPSEGYNGMYRAVVFTGGLHQGWYDEGYEQGKAEGGGECPECPDGGGCTLTTRTITENGTYRPNEGFDLNMIDFSQNGAFNSLLRVSENTTIEFYFAFKEDWRPNLMSFFGCEDSDWDISTFAARYYSGGIEVKMGTFAMNFNVDEYELADGRIHKMKIGKNYGISIDDQMIVTRQDIINNGIGFEPSATRTIYIGAINSPDVEDSGLNLFWRPFYGYIGPVTIVGDYEGFGEQTFNYEPGDFGWWGEYRILQTGQRLENIYREPGATPLRPKRYYPNADGFSEVTVNLTMGNREIRVNSKKQTEAAGWYGLAGFSEVFIDATDFYNSAADEGRRFIIRSLEELNVSENGTYEAPGIYDEYKETHRYVENTGAYLTDFRPQLDDSAVDAGGFEIEVQAKVSFSEGGEKFIVGCAAERYWENAGIDTVINNVVLKANVDATCLYMSGVKTYNMPTINDEWVTYRITENGLDYKRELQQEWSHLDWEGDIRPRDLWNNKGNDSFIAIGGLNTFYDGLFNDFQGSIRYVRFKQGDYDKVWLPEGGQIRAEGTDDFLDVQDGEAPDFVMDSFKTGTQGWKKVNVNIDFNKVEMTLDEYLSLSEYDNNTIYLLN